MSRDPAAARTALLDAGAWFADLVGEIRPHHWTRPRPKTSTARSQVRK